MGREVERVDVRPHIGTAERKWILFPAFSTGFARGAALGGVKWDGRSRILSVPELPCMIRSYKERVVREGRDPKGC